VVTKELLDEIGHKIPIIIGPTAVGKTNFAIELAKKIDGEIISIDSRQIYKGFKIGTAQPTIDEQLLIPHYLVDITHPCEVISAGKYIKLIKDSIFQIKEKNKKPIIAGGTMLYIQALCFGIIDQADSNPEYRQKYFDQIKAGDVNFLLNKLKLIDPEYFEKVSTNDHKKLVRALEIFDITGMSPSDVFSQQIQKDKMERTNYFLIEITLEREKLRNKIQQRTHQMVKNGWIEEVQHLLNNDITTNLHPMQSVGYKQIISYLNHEITKNEMIELISTKTWQYAKKQLTWLKKMEIDFKINIGEA
jgi:tRNA dimethylallyltransferase